MGARHTQPFRALRFRMISYYALLLGVCGAAPAPKLAVLWPEGYEKSSSVFYFARTDAAVSLADISWNVKEISRRSR